MICFEVSLNQQVMFTAGVAEGLVTLNLIRYLISGTEECRLSVVATSRKADGNIDQPNWAELHPKVGDEITVKIVDRDECDPPQ
jgi:hypothetical protein